MDLRAGNKTHWWLLLLATIPASGIAADVYVCKGANGTKIFQQEPCPKNSKPIAHATYDRQPDAPSAEPISPADVSGYAARVERTSTGSAVAIQPSDTSQQQAVAYQCTAASRNWIQSTPCPSTYTRSVPVHVNGYAPAGQFVEGITKTGQYVQGYTTAPQPVDGTGTVEQQAPVQQQKLDSASLCSRLDDDNVHIQHSGHSDVYERNVAKSKYCH